MEDLFQRRISLQQVLHPDNLRGGARVCSSAKKLPVTITFMADQQDRSIVIKHMIADVR